MADYGFIVSSGVVVPDTADTLDQVRGEFRAALGADLDLSPETPQGVLIAAEVEARDAVARNNAELANQINPNLAGGVFLDAIWALTGGQRVPATPTIVRGVVLGGVAGTIVPAGALAALGPNGAQFALLSGAVLIGGSATGTFQAVEPGATVVAPGALSAVISPVLGWETVTNPAEGEVGATGETDAASRVRRRQTLALQGVALPEAIVSGLHTVPGARSLTFRENTTAAPVTIEGVTLAAHSIYACVDGGTDAAVAAMLLRKKSLGAGWNGGTTVNTVDPYSGQTYPVQFARPALVTIYVQVTVTANGAAFSDIPATVKSALLAYAAGELEGEDGFVVGGDVSAFELAGAVNRVAAPLYVRNLVISSNGTTYSAAEIPITIAQKANLVEGNILVTVA